MPRYKKSILDREKHRNNKSTETTGQHKMAFGRDCIVLLEDIGPSLPGSEAEERKRPTTQSLLREISQGPSEESNSCDNWSTCSSSSCSCSTCSCTSSDEEDSFVSSFQEDCSNSFTSHTSYVSPGLKRPSYGESSLPDPQQTKLVCKTVTPTKNSVEPYVSAAPKPLKKRALKVPSLTYSENSDGSCSSFVSQPVKKPVGTLLTPSEECSKRSSSSFVSQSVKKRYRKVSSCSFASSPSEDNNEEMSEVATESSKTQAIKSSPEEYFKEGTPEITSQSLKKRINKPSSPPCAEFSKASSSKVVLQPTRRTPASSKPERCQRFRKSIPSVQSKTRATASPVISLSERVKAFKCIKCAYFSISKASVMKHFKQEHCKSRKWKCIVCDFETLYYGVYLNHSRQHFAGPPFSCTACLYETNVFQNLLKHMPVHVKDYKCNSCEFACKTSVTLNKHKRKVHNEEDEFKCVTCGKSYKRAKNLEKHVKMDHGKVNKAKDAA